MYVELEFMFTVCEMKLHCFVLDGYSILVMACYTLEDLPDTCRLSCDKMPVMSA